MRNSISIYKLLEISNLLLLLAMFAVYFSVGNTHYINEYTIVINSLITCISFAVIRDAQRNDNQLLTILSLMMILFFQMRVVTLNWTEYTEVLDFRVKTDSSGYNYALCFVCVAYVVLWRAVHIESLHKPDGINLSVASNAGKRVLVFLYCAFTIDVATALDVPVVAQTGRYLSTFFFNFLFMLMLGFCYFISRWKKESRSNKIALFALIIIYIAVYTLIGRRATIYGIFVFLVFAALALNKIRIKKIYIFIALIISPIMILFFSYSTFLRSMGEKTLDISTQEELLTTFGENLRMNDFKVVISPVFDRVGYLDWADEMIINRDFLKNYIKPSYYFESIVDNLLTPGFNIYDMPKMSNVIEKCYEYKVKPNTITYKLDYGQYKSDGMSLYGEAYLLLGPFFSLFYILIIGLFLRNFYNKNKNGNQPQLIWKRIIVFYMFYEIIGSFGLDWSVIHLVSFIINYYIYNWLIRENKVNKKLIVSV